MPISVSTRKGGGVLHCCVVTGDICGAAHCAPALVVTNNTHNTNCRALRHDVDDRLVSQMVKHANLFFKYLQEDVCSGDSSQAQAALRTLGVLAHHTLIAKLELARVGQ